MFISRRAVITMIHPKDGDIRLDLHGQMQDGSLVRTKIGRNDRATRRLGHRPTHNFKRGFRAQLGIPTGHFGKIHKRWEKLG